MNKEKQEYRQLTQTARDYIRFYKYDKTDEELADQFDISERTVAIVKHL